jgi:hypothetical protein
MEHAPLIAPPAWERPRPRSHHAVVAGVAAVLSLLLHYLVLEKLPPFHFGRPVIDTVRERYRPFEMDTTRRPPPPRVEEPARFRPENPGQVTETFGPAPVPNPTDIPLPLPEAPPVAAGPLRGEQAPMAGPAEAPARTRWEPRQDLVQVQEPLYADTVIALPRRYIEQVPRTALAPDYVLPAEVSEIAAGAAGDGTTGDANRLVAGVSVPRALPRGYGGGGAPAPADLNPLEPPTMAEDPREVTGFLPAEQYLALDVHAFHPPDEPDTTYFEVRIARKGEEVLPVVPKDMLILQDCSESMTSWKLIECKAGLRRWVMQLNPLDRFELIGFRDAPQPCFGTWAEATEANRRRALQYIDDLRASGNTDVYASLAAARSMPRDVSRPLVAVLVTDGRPTSGATDSSDIISRFTQGNAGQVSMFTYGAGRRVNRFLLDLLSYRNRGDSMVMMETDRIPATLERWTGELGRPVLTDLRYQFTGLDESQIFPSTLTHLYLDRPLVIHGRVKGPVGKTAFQVVGRNQADLRDFVFALDLGAARPGDAELRTRWVWHRIYELIGRYAERHEPAVLVEMQALARRYQLDVPYGQDLTPTP